MTSHRLWQALALPAPSQPRFFYQAKYESLAGIFLSFNQNSMFLHAYLTDPLLLIRKLLRNFNKILAVNSSTIMESK